LSSLCTLAGYSRQAFYGFEKHHVHAVFEEDLIIQEVLRHRKLQPRLGTRKLMVLLQDFTRQHHIKLGRDALFDLLRTQNLLIRKRKRKVQTTFSRHPFNKYKNLVVGYEPLAPNLLWVSDITYVCVADGFAYLSLVTDAFSKKVVGYYLSETLEASGSLKALQKALRGCKDVRSLIHHSDRGIQYCSTDYVKALQQRAVKISMTEHGDPLENAIAERVNGILKEELLQASYKSFKAAEKSVDQAIFIYNSLRPHSSCDMLTPMEAHLKEGRLKKHWKNYYKQKEVAMDSS
jgi:transposase InsO family protein